jgi:hypothetical protein
VAVCHQRWWQCATQHWWRSAINVDSGLPFDKENKNRNLKNKIMRRIFRITILLAVFSTVLVSKGKAELTLFITTTGNVRLEMFQF